MSRLLMNDFVIPVSIKLAEKIGLYEAMFLQQLHYWLQQSENVHEGYKWVYNTYEDWHKQLPFLSVNQIRRIVRELEKKKLIVTGNFNRLKMDKTKWYRINYEAVEQVCESVNNSKMLIEPCQNECCPQNVEMAEQSVEGTDESTRQTIETSSNEQDLHLDNIYDNHSTVIETHSDNIPAPARPYTNHRTIPKTTSETTPEMMIDDVEYVRETNPFQFFEENGFGTVGSYLAEKILAWSKDLSLELVVEAMKLAVEFGCKHWKYVEAILRQWADKGYQTVEEVRAAQLQYKEKMSRRRNQSYEKQGRDIPQFVEYDYSLGEEE